MTPGWSGWPPLGAVVDLDDTLYPQAQYLAGALAAVARRAGALGLDGRALRAALATEMAAGSDRGGTIDRALAAIGVSGDDSAIVLSELVGTFTGFRPASLTGYPGASKALAELRAHLPVVCLTDGNPGIQRAKLAALGLASAFDGVVLTDEIGGRATRKPHPAGLLRAAALLGVAPPRLVVIGDRPDKDVAIATECGATAIRVRQGEYCEAPNSPQPWAGADDFPAAVGLALGLLTPSLDPTR